MKAVAINFEIVRDETFGVIGVYRNQNKYEIHGVILWKGTRIHPVLEKENIL